jgi:hypothetical protein
MQATMRIDRSKIAREARVLAAFAVAVAAALTLGYGIGQVTGPKGHAAPTVSVLSGSSGQSASERQVTHGALP